MALLNPTLSPATNFINIEYYIEKAGNVIGTAEAYLDKLIPGHSDGTETGLMHSLENNYKIKVGELIEKIERHNTIITTLTKLANELSELVRYCVDKIEYFAAQYLIKKLQLLGLRLKSLLLHVKIRIAKFTKHILISMINGKAAAITSALVALVILKIQVMGTLIGAALKAIDSLLNLLPGVVAVKPSAMAFFPTPKSLKKVDIVAININQSICDRLPEPIKVAIREAVKVTDKLNVPIKLAIIAACAASGIAQAKSKNKDFKIVGCKRLSLLDPEKVAKAIEFIVSLIPIPQGLPKYERLSLINLGYLAWLLTSFELAGKRTFGMPGLP